MVNNSFCTSSYAHIRFFSVTPHTFIFLRETDADEAMDEDYDLVTTSREALEMLEYPMLA